jgi:hypothetical protein
MDLSVPDCERCFWCWAGRRGWFHCVRMGSSHRVGQILECTGWTSIPQGVKECPLREKNGEGEGWRCGVSCNGYAVCTGRGS